MTGLTVASWHREHAEVEMAGSLYAAAPDDRLEAARALHIAGCWVHVDVIIDGSGVAIGVSLDELAAVRSALPEALLDVHLIVLPGLDDSGRAAAAAAVVAAVVDCGVQRLSVAPRLLGPDGPATLRSVGVAVWYEVADASAADVPSDADGALVMLITPGTAEAADVSRLEAVEALSGRLPVGVDGGVTDAVALLARSAGADYLVSGRALLVRGPRSTITEREGQP